MGLLGFKVSRKSLYRVLMGSQTPVVNVDTTSSDQVIEENEIWPFRKK